MNINDLEDRNLNQKPQKPIVKLPNDSNDEADENPVQTYEHHSHRSSHDWLLITKLVAALSVCIGLILGLVAGFAVGRITAPAPSTEEENPDNETNSIYSQYDYSKFVINGEKNITIENFYSDDEEKYYAMTLIGTKIPTLKYLNSANEELSTESLGNGRYILEFLEPDCSFCQSMIDVMDEYRQAENSIPVIGLSIKNGDLSKTFNKNEENSFILINKDNATDTLVNQIAWIPTFLYIENNEIKLVSFGVLTVEEIAENASIAFGDTQNPPAPSTEEENH